MHSVHHCPFLTKLWDREGNEDVDPEKEPVTSPAVRHWVLPSGDKVTATVAGMFHFYKPPARQPVDLSVNDPTLDVKNRSGPAPFETVLITEALRFWAVEENEMNPAHTPSSSRRLAIWNIDGTHRSLPIYEVTSRVEQKVRGGK